MALSRILSRARAALVLASTLLAACGGSDGPVTVDNNPATVRLSQNAPLTLQSGQSATLTASVLAKDGHALTTTATWSSSDASVASVVNGVITAAKVGSATITATAGVAQATISVSVTAGSASRLVIRTQPVGAQIGSALAVQPVLEFQDNAGNVATSATFFVTATVESGSGTLSGTTAVAASSGVVTFTDLKLAGTAGAFTLRFTAGTLTATSSSLTMSAPPTPARTITYGSATDRVRVLDVNAAYTPATSVIDSSGTLVAGAVVAYASRSSTVATVDASGRVTAKSPGDAWIVASAPGAADSVFVVVPANVNGPVLRTSATNYSARAGDTLFITLVLDTRTTTVGAASFALDIAVNVGGLVSVPAGPPAPLVVANVSGVYRISVADANGMKGNIALFNLKLVGRTAGITGFLNLYALDVAGVDGSSLTAQTTATRFPIVIR